jgi:hypothetical protein
MTGKFRNWIMMAALTTSPLTARAQDTSPALPLAPVPVVPSSPPPNGVSEPVPPPSTAHGPASVQPPSAPVPGYLPPSFGPGYVPVPPPPSVIYPYPDTSGPWVRGDSGLDRPQTPPPGLLFNLDFDVVGVHLKNRLQAPVTDGSGATYVVQLPTASLDWTVSPRFELGYRFPQGCGELLLSYRFLTTDGRQTLAGFDLDGGDVPLRSRLNVNVVDLDYASPEFSPLPHWNVQARLGARIATVYFDSLADGYYITEQTSNNFVGGGPHFGVDARRTLDLPGLSFFSRIDGAVVIGRVHQSFEEAYVTADGSVVGGATDIHNTQGVPVLSFLAGLSWTPQSYHWRRYSLGYVFEQWWGVGQAGLSHADLTSQGVFFRAEFSF